ncbi:hypothetical protein QRO08_22185 [Paracidovorax citrulli]|uniref:Uncharacterized protein n=1 Tax=Paracidovorax citrulli TaxID=80869 RepID=A0ABY9ANJ3_PARCI|nr:hypothetical protein [Paracidovorax citrulli]MVT29585.1 hypothetical protein [Paracidovorax citrulli]MVT37979.1 hypothetical protein [Paracidovorax citrulli]UMT85119.1 hypothetical protein FRC75_18050 [Paracidovorax citrulli]WIY28942.1 hypothetical protein QRO09_18065 [Paracidovorax citrulli]WIY38173.1 hypothetical protein QRO10_18335 [Paracidovorax citrulli]
MSFLSLVNEAFHQRPDGGALHLIAMGHVSDAPQHPQRFARNDDPRAVEVVARQGAADQRT